MDLLARAELTNDPSLRRRTETAISAELVTILRTTLVSQATDALKKALRVKQRWAQSALGDQTLLHKVLLMLTSSVSDAVIDNGLTDAEIKAAVVIAIDCLAGVEYAAVTETLPAP